jgi:phosphoenolpyruvate phosphomutase
MYYATPASAFRKAGISVVIWANHNLRASISAMREVSRRIREEESLVGVEGAIASVREVFALAGNWELEEAERRYLGPPPAVPRAVVIAASRGAALGPLTAERPKCMIDVRGQPLLRRLVGTLRECGVGDVTVVRGYRKEAIDLPSIATVDNDAYETTGEAASLACAIDRLEGPCVLSYGDILFRRHLLDALLAAEGDVVIAVDALQRNRAADADPERVSDLVGCSRRHTGDYLEDEAPVWLQRIGNDLSAAQADGEWIGLAKLSPTGAALVRGALDAMRADGSLLRASLLEMLSRLIAAGHPIGVVYVLGGWLDVDDAFDLARARNFT